MSALAIVFIGWPAILASLYLIARGLRTFEPRAALAGAMLATPFLVYLSGSGRFRYIALFAMLLYYTAPIALSYRRRGLAMACAAPYVGLVAMGGWFVVRSREEPYGAWRAAQRLTLS
jgi:hypothetical protein